RLREQSLLVLEEREEEPCFRMLETVREYAQSKLKAEGKSDAIAEKHATHYLETARLQEGRLRETGAASAFQLLSARVDNLRAAQDWLWKSERYALAAEMYLDLGEFWERKGWYREERAYLDQAVQRLDSLPEDSLRARVLKSAGWIAYLLGDLTDAEGLTQRCLDASIEANLHDIQANALNNLALIAQSRHALDKAEHLLQESIAILRTLGNDRALADRLSNLGLLESTLGHSDQAQACLEEARKIYERHSDTKGVAGWLCNQSDLALKQTNWTEAFMLAGQSLQRFRQVDDRLGIACALANQAEAASRLGQHEVVDAALNEAYSICADTKLYFLAPILLLTYARSQAERQQIRSAAMALAAVRRLHTLLEIPDTPHEQQEMQLMERELRQKDTENLLDAVTSAFAEASMEDILAQLPYPR
ncbi:MAG TPA: tetratricopeptide repeat protein, partial [Chthonomonadaceae bacterium]|nr:tetratricopeptide repeat protein [Chthonomonadaceae bacterium]